MNRLLALTLFLCAVIIPQRTISQQLWGMTLRGGSDRGGVVYKVNADNSSFVETVHEFTVDIQAQNPIGPMVLASNNKFYGITARGGANDQGTIFEFDPITEDYTTKWSFTAPDILPQGGMIQASNGKLYGTCSVGGTSGGGTIYSFDIANGVFTRVFSFANLTAHGKSPSGELVEGVPGKLYGVNKDGGGPGNSGIGVIFEFDFNALTLAKLYTFTNAGGTRPAGGVTIGADGKFYGVTVSGGASNRGEFYSFNKTSSTFTKIFEFQNNDGGRPSSTPITHSNGKIYGTSMGSSLPNSFGTDDGLIYEYDPAPGGTGFTIKDRFGDGSNEVGFASFGGLCESPGGKLYALTVSDASSIIEYDPATGTATARLANLPVNIGARADNAFAVGPGGDLFTSYVEGGAAGAGTIVKYSILMNAATKLLDLGYSSSGAYPYGDLVEASNGKLYGMLPTGGDHGVGIIFEIDPTTGVLTKRFDFDGANGATPLGGMITSSNGKLYGTTTFGGPSTVERSYQDYPTSIISGARGLGVLFEFDPSTNAFTKKADFTIASGTNPYGKLVEASNGKLYGVTSADGALGGGTLYEYVINGAITRYHDFAVPVLVDGPVNAGPKGQLVELDGKLYGTTPFLGVNNGGTLFEFDLSSNTLTTNASFSSATNTSLSSLGATPDGGLVVHSGKLYGATSDGGVNAGSTGFGGTLYEYTPGSTTVVKRLDLPVDAKAPLSLMVAHQGKLFGTFNYSPNLNGGVFQYDPATNIFTRKFQFDGSNGASPQWGALTLVVANKLGQSIAFPQPEIQEFTATPTFSPFISIPTASSVGLPVMYTSSDPAVARVDVSGKITIVGVGTSTITATQGGNNIYESVTIVRTVTVVKGHQTITWPPPVLTPRLSQGTVILLASSSSGLPVTYTSDNEDIATVTGNVLTLKHGGVVNITASQAGTSNYLAAADISIPFSIQRGDQSITFATISAKEVSDLSFTLTATATSLLPITYTTPENSVATVNGNTVTILAPGTIMITASQPGNDDWNPATPVVRPVIINKIPQTIIFNMPDRKVLGGPPFTLVATASSDLAVAFTTTSTGRVTISGNTVTALRAGPVAITANQAGNSTYKEATAVTRTFCIDPSKPVIAAGFTNTGTYTLTTVAAGTLQWFHNDDPIPSATDPSLIPTVAGGYTVIVNVEGCVSATSDIEDVIVTGVEPTKSMTAALHPNPVSDQLYIAIPNNQGSSVRIFGMDGRAMMELFTVEDEVVLEVGEFPEGLYVVKARGENLRFLKK